MSEEEFDRRYIECRQGDRVVRWYIKLTTRGVEEHLARGTGRVIRTEEW